MVRHGIVKQTRAIARASAFPSQYEHVASTVSIGLRHTG